MSSKVDYFLNKTLGEDFFESLQKVELWKPGTKTTLDHEEIKTALQIVPRVIMSLLIRELAPMGIEESKEIQLPVEGTASLSATKKERDVYIGNIRLDDKILVDFKYRSIPGIGLVVMSAFELYDVDSLEEVPEIDKDLSYKIQKIVDERLELHDLIGKVVDRKIEHKEAIRKIVLKKLTNSIEEPKEIEQTPIIIPLKRDEQTAQHKKISKFREYMEKKRKPKEFSLEMIKGEVISCPDCGNALISDRIFTGCVCLGDNRESKVYIKKHEDGIKIRFGRGWDQDNIVMLLQALRRKHE
jgi:hypothetical protein